MGSKGWSPTSSTSYRKHSDLSERKRSTAKASSSSRRRLFRLASLPQRSTCSRFGAKLKWPKQKPLKQLQLRKKRKRVEKTIRKRAKMTRRTRRRKRRTRKIKKTRKT